MNLFEQLHDNAVLDNDLLLKNDATGDLFEKPRDVDFTFKTGDGRKAKELSEFINGKNFGISTVHSGDDGLLWVIVAIHMPITQHLLCSVSGFMVCLGGLFQVEYDGWGSVIQNAQQPRT
jgi:hypothetical protein